jgi:putative transcriptional regulator
MKPELFAELLTAANQALEHARGKRSLRSTALPQPPAPMTAKDVRAVRDRLQASQGVLARCLNVSTKLVQAWEAGERTPSGPALVLLRMVEQQPGLVEMLYSHHPSANVRNFEHNGSASRQRVAHR